MKHKRFIAILFILAQMGVYGQGNPRETVTVGDDIFLPYLPGKVVQRINGNDVHSQKIFSIMFPQQKSGMPQGYEVEAYSDGLRNLLEINLMPYLFDDGEIVRKAGSSVVFYFNDPRSLLGLPINSDLDDFYLSPVKIAEFMGYPIYMNERGEAIVIYKGREPLFLPVSQDEYLTALISAEAKKEKEHPQTVTVDDNLIEMELAYQQLLKMDKAAAADFKKEMDRFRKDASQRRETEQLSSAYKIELAKLSPAQRKQPAYYAVYAMEKYGNLSGLVPENETGESQPVVKPNLEALAKNSNEIHLIVCRWRLSSDAQRGSPRLYEPRHTVGFSLTDDRIYEMYNNQNLWKHIIDEVH